ncbi:DUF411 domain-containing protein [Massilia sp. H6]|uniref:DUF411 domain-containing protein n=1 Tax=Massilia sp. H6 TaxID=2970464 RepID=UPI002169464B|nr:DUF411 domain-containing protein [Massilia sp. H6]UVW30657.1 DUF411 domain-containing protein [Massilia sp. H6]
MKRRLFSQVALAAALFTPVFAMAAAPIIEVFKTESCGCCGAWVEHLKANGFATRVVNVENPSDYRQRGGIPDKLGSCHTGMVQGYAIEGHVPASDIKRLLAQKPKAKGLAVPAMPLGSPGMEGPRKDPYDVLLVQANGSTKVFKHYN